jgi:hypothetical protein
MFYYFTSGREHASRLNLAGMLDAIFTGRRVKSVTWSIFGSSHYICQALN